jgi:hypothetical protein
LQGKSQSLDFSISNSFSSNCVRSAERYWSKYLFYRHRLFVKTPDCLKG